MLPNRLLLQYNPPYYMHLLDLRSQNIEERNGHINLLIKEEQLFSYIVSCSLRIVTELVDTGHGPVWVRAADEIRGVVLLQEGYPGFHDLLVTK